MPLDANPAANRAAVDQILKEFYLGPIREQLNSDTLLARRLAKNSENVEGRIVVIPLHTGRNVGIQAALEGGLLADPGNQTYTDMRFPVKYNYGRIKVSGPALASARTSRGAFVRVLDSEIKGLVRDFKNDLNRQRFGDASGRLGTVDALPGGAVMGVRQPWDQGGQAPRLKWFQVGDRVAYSDVSVGSSPIAAFAGGIFQPITAVNIGARTITVGAGIGAVALGDHIVKGNSQIAVAYNDSNARSVTAGLANDDAKEIMGLVGMCSGLNGWTSNSVLAYAAIAEGQTYAGQDAVPAPLGVNLQGVVSAGSVWNSNMLFNGGVPRAVTTDLFQQGFDLGEEIGQATPSIGICSYGVRRAYVNTLTPDRRFIEAQAYNLDGGFKAIDFNGVPVVPEKDCPEGNLFWLAEDHFAEYRMSDYYWLDKDGAILQRTQGRDSWEAILALYMEQGIDRRNAQTVVGDLLI